MLILFGGDGFGLFHHRTGALQVVPRKDREPKKYQRTDADGQLIDQSVADSLPIVDFKVTYILAESITDLNG